MTEDSEHLYAQEYFDYLQNRSIVRRQIRKLYLNHIRSFCVEETIDFGCGIGELLSLLPEGSIGFEVNHVAVNFCRSKGLKVAHYSPDKDDYRFEMLDKG